MPSDSGVPSLDVERAPPALRDAVERYRDLGGMIGILTYALWYLETSDEEAAAAAARIPTALFVASSLHDDAIDERDPDASRDKTRLNHRVTTGDLWFTDVVEAVAALPDEVDASAIVSAIRAIGAGQLDEERPVGERTAVDPDGGGRTPVDDEERVRVDDEERVDQESRVDAAVERVERRGPVWGELMVAIVEAGCDYDERQLDRLDTIVGDLLFVFALLDDVADLPEDVENGVPNALVVLHGDDPNEADQAPDEPAATERPDDTHQAPDGRTREIVESILDSDVPERVERLIERREDRIEDAARRFHEETDRDDRELLAALDRGLRWYCESVCSAPVAETVPPSLQAEIRSGLSGDAGSRREFLEQLADELPLAIPVDVDAPPAVEELPPDELASVVIRLAHVQAVADEEQPSTLDEALAKARQATQTEE